MASNSETSESSIVVSNNRSARSRNSGEYLRGMFLILLYGSEQNLGYFIVVWVWGWPTGWAPGGQPQGGCGAAAREMRRPRAAARTGCRARRTPPGNVRVLVRSTGSPG